MKIAVIAHDGKKAEMVAFLNRHMDFLYKEFLIKGYQMVIFRKQFLIRCGKMS